MSERKTNITMPRLTANQLLMATLLCTLLTGCGGGGSDNNASNPSTATATTNSGPATTSKLGETTTLHEQLTDNASNIINLSYTAEITSINADGGYVVTRSTVGGSTPVVNGTNYAINNVENYSAAGTSTSIVYKQVSPNRSCSFSGSTTPVVFPLSASLTWSKQWTKTCADGSSTTVAITNGHYVGQESLTIQAGTFTANHTAFTRTETTALATPLVITSTYDCWYEATSNRQLKCQWTSSRSGGTPSSNGYVVSGMEEVQSSSYAMASHTPPVAGTSSVFKRTIIDNESNTISFNFTNSITNVNADGSYATSTITEGNNQELLDGTSYELSSTSSYSANGTLLSSTRLLPNRTCTYPSDNAQAVVYPLSVGLSWSKMWTVNCTDGFYGTLALSSAQVVDIEPITVAAGTFSAYKVQYTLTSTPTTVTNPIVWTSAYTCWIDAETGKTVKCALSSSHTGTISNSNGYATSITDELQSFH